MDSDNHSYSDKEIGGGGVEKGILEKHKSMFEEREREMRG